jgi:hypothetical protein
LEHAIVIEVEMKKFFTIIVASIMTSSTWAANLAYDDASDSAYSGGFTNGSNGGYGFGPWTLYYINANVIIGDSTSNGDGVDDGNSYGTIGDGDINTAGVAWGFFPFGYAYASRPFTGGPLDVGQTFSIDLDGGAIDAEGWLRVTLADAFDNGVFVLAANNTTYSYTDAEGYFPTGFDTGTEGARLEISMIGATNYQAQLTRFDGSSISWSGSMVAPPESVSVYA